MGGSDGAAAVAAKQSAAWTHTPNPTRRHTPQRTHKQFISRIAFNSVFAIVAITKNTEESPTMQCLLLHCTPKKNYVHFLIVLLCGGRVGDRACVCVVCALIKLIGSALAIVQNNQLSVWADWDTQKLCTVHTERAYHAADIVFRFCFGSVAK